MRRYRSVSIAVFAIVFCTLVGGFYGRAALAIEDQVPDQYKVFTAALNAIDVNYVGTVESDRLVYGAIAGMLQTLDPHSSFMDPRTYAQMRERQEGRYYGLGITIAVVDGEITVVSLFEGSPAYQKGLRRGDIIAKIEGEETKGWTSDDAVRKLRGPKGTPVRISLKRSSYDQLIDLAVIRDEIHIPTVPAAFMLDAQTGYVRLSEFGENTDQELGQSLRALNRSGMKRLVLDLRNNPGGALDQAIKVANRFLPRGNMVVYTRGRVPNSDQDYRATESSDYLSVPMVTLTNRSSASASEIVSGALQDHDRSLIVGETTFGKALVQSVYRVSEGAGVAVTTAHYIFDVYAQRFARKGDTRITQAPTATLRDLSPGFEVTDAMVAEFRDLVEKSKLKIDEADWQKDLTFIKAMIRYEIDLDLFGVEAARKDLVKTDPQLQFAVTLFPEAQRLLDMGKITSTQRAAR